MIQQNFTTLENLFLALSDKTRLRLLALMADGEVSVGYLAEQLGESQPKISRHLAYLRGAGLVSTRRDGKWVYYGIATQRDAGAQDVLDKVLRVVQGSDDGQRIAKVGDHRSPDNGASPNTYAEAYTNGWAPNDIEIYLL
jgi:DNA-binding transcriptional ArsR family regulator